VPVLVTAREAGTDIQTEAMQAATDASDNSDEERPVKKQKSEFNRYLLCTCYQSGCRVTRLNVERQR